MVHYGRQEHEEVNEYKLRQIHHIHKAKDKSETSLVVTLLT